VHFTIVIDLDALHDAFKAREIAAPLGKLHQISYMRTVLSVKRGLYHSLS
jgi:hypothetical protein